MILRDVTRLSCDVLFEQCSRISKGLAAAVSKRRNGRLLIPFLNQNAGEQFYYSKHRYSCIPKKIKAMVDKQMDEREHHVRRMDEKKTANCKQNNIHNAVQTTLSKVKLSQDEIYTDLNRHKMHRNTQNMYFHNS